MNKTSPILLILFNRPDSAHKIFQKIREARPEKLFISADGPRPQFKQEAELCQLTRFVVENIDWPCDVYRQYLDINLGIKAHFLKALDWFFNKVPSGIILEHDCLPDASFFPYCTELLNRYQNNDAVFSINGFNFGYDKKEMKESYGFTRYMSSWGFATWRRTFQKIDFKFTKWNALETNKKVELLKNKLGLENNENDYQWLINSFNLIQLISSPESDFWDLQWCFNTIIQEGLVAFPKINLIHNLGIGDERATHTSSNLVLGDLLANSLASPLQHPNHFNIDPGYEQFFREVSNSSRVTCPKNTDLFQSLNNFFLGDPI